MKKTIITLNSSQIKQFVTCPMAWNLRSAQSLGLHSEGRKPALDWGTLTHYVLEHFYRGRFEGNGLIEATEAMKFRDKRIPKDDELSIAQIWDLYPEKQEKLRERYMQYCMSKAMEPNHWKPKSSDHVEVGFTTVIYEDDQFIFVLEGRIDLLIATILGDTVIDHKTQSRLEFLSLTKLQFPVYCLGAQCPNIIVNYVMLTDKFDKYTFRTDGTTYSKAQLDWYREWLVKEVFWKVAKWQIEKKLGSCSGTYDSQECMYKSYCWEPSEEMAERILRHKYVTIKTRRSW